MGMTAAAWARVFSGGRPFYYVADLMKLGGLSYEAARKASARLERQGFLVRVGPQLLANALRPPTLEMLATTLRRPAYVSLQSALHFHGALDQAPPEITCVTVGRPGIVATPMGTISYHRISPRLFGALCITGEFAVASPEKALLDHCYLESRSALPPLPGDLDPDVFDAERLRSSGFPFPVKVVHEALLLAGA